MNLKLLEKTEIQQWLKTIPFSHFITVEPNAAYPFRRDEVEQRMRKVEFRLNKKYLKSSWSTWDAYQRFWMVGFQEGTGIETHFHMMLYTPEVLNRPLKFSQKNVSWDLFLFWMNEGRFNPMNGKKVPFKPLDIRKVEDVTASTIYSSKWLSRIDSADSYFFTTPPKTTFKKLAA